MGSLLTYSARDYTVLFHQPFPTISVGSHMSFDHQETAIQHTPNTPQTQNTSDRPLLILGWLHFTELLHVKKKQNGRSNKRTDKF
jgi:hypothetical protein